MGLGTVPDRMKRFRRADLSMDGMAASSAWV